MVTSGAPQKPWEHQNSTTQSVLSVVQPDWTNPSGQESSVAPGNVNNSSPFPSQPYNPRFTGSFGSGYNYGPGYHNNGYGYNLPNFPEQFLSPNTALGAAEQRLRAALSTISALVRAFGGLSQMLDSTVYAAWSSVMAIVAVAEQFRYLRQEHLRRWLELLKSAIAWLLHTLKLSKSNGRPLTISGSQSRTSVESIPPTRSSLTKNASKLFIPAIIAGGAYVLWQGISWTKSEGSVAKALFNFTAMDPACISLEAGDDLIVLKYLDSSDWLNVRNVKSGLVGFVPASYVGIVDSRQ